MTKNQIIKHYKDFFDLHAKGIPLDEDDHLNIDWALDLIQYAQIHKEEISDENAARQVLNYSFRGEEGEIHHCQVDKLNGEMMLGNVISKLNEVHRFIKEFQNK